MEQRYVYKKPQHQSDPPEFIGTEMTLYLDRDAKQQKQPGSEPHKPEPEEAGNNADKLPPADFQGSQQPLHGAERSPIQNKKQQLDRQVVDLLPELFADMKHDKDINNSEDQCTIKRPQNSLYHSLLGSDLPPMPITKKYISPIRNDFWKKYQGVKGEPNSNFFYTKEKLIFHEEDDFDEPGESSSEGSDVEWAKELLIRAKRARQREDMMNSFPRKQSRNGKFKSVHHSVQTQPKLASKKPANGQKNEVIAPTVDAQVQAPASEQRRYFQIKHWVENDRKILEVNENIGLAEVRHNFLHWSLEPKEGEKD